MRAFVAFLSVCVVLGLVINSAKDSPRPGDPAPSYSAAATSPPTKRDPETARMMLCRGDSTTAWPDSPMPNRAQCVKIIKDTANVPSRAIFKDLFEGSPASRALATTLLKMKINQLNATYALMCGLRSQAYFNTLRNGFMQIAYTEANRLQIVGDELNQAESESNRELEAIRKLAAEIRSAKDLR